MYNGHLDFRGNICAHYTQVNMVHNNYSSHTSPYPSCVEVKLPPGGYEVHTFTACRF